MTEKQKAMAERVLGGMTADERAATERLAAKHGTTPAEEVARVMASAARVDRKPGKARDIGVPPATGDAVAAAAERAIVRAYTANAPLPQFFGEAVAQVAAADGITCDEVHARIGEAGIKARLVNAALAAVVRDAAGGEE